MYFMASLQLFLIFKSDIKVNVPNTKLQHRRRSFVPACWVTETQCRKDKTRVECMCACSPHTLALFSRLGPWYRYTVSLPVFTCLSISLFQWWISEAGQMIRVPLETTRLESWMINKQTEFNQSVLPLNNQFKTDLQNSDKTRSFDPI